MACLNKLESEIFGKGKDWWAAGEGKPWRRYLGEGWLCVRFLLPILPELEIGLDLKVAWFAAHLELQMTAFPGS